MATRTEVIESYESAKELLGTLVEWGADRRNFHDYEYYEDEPDDPWRKLQFANIERLYEQRIPLLMERIGKVLPEVPNSFVNGWIFVPDGSRNCLDAAHRLGQEASNAAENAIEECCRQSSEEPLERFREMLYRWIQPEPELLRNVKKDLDYERDGVLANCQESNETSLPQDKKNNSNGPIEPSGFRWNEMVFMQLRPTAFRLLKFHWGDGCWLTRYFDRDRFDRDVFHDPDSTVDRGRLDGHQTKINQKFFDARMMLYMRVESDRSFVHEISEIEFEELHQRRKRKRNR